MVTLDIEVLKKELKDDSEIRNDQLEEESRKTPALHAKWVAFLADERRTFSQLNKQLKRLEHQRSLYYMGKQSPAYIRDNGGPFQYKILKSEVATWIGQDAQVQDLQIAIEESEARTELILEAVKSINSRGWTIKNIITWLQFSSGMGG